MKRKTKSKFRPSGKLVAARAALEESQHRNRSALARSIRVATDSGDLLYRLEELAALVKSGKCPPFEDQKIFWVTTLEGLAFRARKLQIDAMAIVT